MKTKTEAEKIEDKIRQYEKKIDKLIEKKKKVLMIGFKISNDNR